MNQDLQQYGAFPSNLTKIIVTLIKIKLLANLQGLVPANIFSLYGQIFRQKHPCIDISDKLHKKQKNRKRRN